jgi:DNA polymerase III delta prime subunit
MDKVMRCLKADVPVLLWGPPGVGKTSALRALAGALNAHLEVLSAESTSDADLLGVRIVDPATRTAPLAPPDWVVRCRTALDRGQRVIVFLDEVTCWPRSSTAALLGLVANRHFAGIDLGGARIVGAANPPEIADGEARPLSPPAANRWRHIRWEVSPSQWATLARGGYRLDIPQDAGRWGIDPAALAVARSVVASYVVATAQKPDLKTGAQPPLLEPPRDDGGDPAWPSPRSWELACRLAAVGGGWRAESAHDDLAGCIGEQGADRFAAWLSDQELPDPEALLRDPEKHPLPERGDRLAVALDAACSAAVAPHKERPARWQAAWKLLARVPRDIALSPAGILCKARWAEEDLRRTQIPPLAIDLGRVLQAIDGGGK